MWVLVCLAQASAADSANIPTIQIPTIIAELSSADEATVASALSNPAGRVTLEVALAAIARLEAEIAKPAPEPLNISLIKLLLDDLKVRGTPQVFFEFRALRVDFNDRLEKEKQISLGDRQKLIEDFMATETAMNSKTKGLVPLQKPGVPKPRGFNWLPWRRGRSAETENQEKVTTDRETPKSVTKKIAAADGSYAWDSVDRIVNKHLSCWGIKGDLFFQRNYFDDSVARLKSRRPPTAAVGSDRTLQIAGALLKTDKQHTLITSEYNYDSPDLIENLSDSYFQGILPFPTDAIPIFLQVRVCMATANQLTQIATKLVEKTGRDVFLYIDLTGPMECIDEAIKDLPILAARASKNKLIHYIVSADREQARKMASHSFVSEIWTEVVLPEPSAQEVTEYIRNVDFPRWNESLRRSLKISTLPYFTIQEDVLSAGAAWLGSQNISLLKGLRDVLETIMNQKAIGHDWESHPEPFELTTDDFWNFVAHQNKDQENPSRIGADDDLAFNSSHQILGHWAAHVLLERKNIPGDLVLLDPAGPPEFVIAGSAASAKRSSLARQLTEMIILDAGSRAVFINDGSTDSTEATVKEREHIVDIIDKILRQDILTLTEHDSELTQRQARKILRLTVRYAADHIVQVAQKLSTLDQLSSASLYRGILPNQELQTTFTKIIETETLQTPSRLLLEAILDGLQSALTVSRAQPTFEDVTIARDLVTALTYELRVRKTLSEDDERWLDTHPFLQNLEKLITHHSSCAPLLGERATL